jgi:hypothetical protein
VICSFGRTRGRRQHSKKAMQALGGLAVNLAVGMWMPPSATP